MQLNYWQGDFNGRAHGTIACAGGHVHLRSVLLEDKEDWDEIMRLWANQQLRMPPPMPDTEQFLKSIGCEPVEFEHGPAFGPLSDDARKWLADALENERAGDTEEPPPPPTPAPTDPRPALKTKNLGELREIAQGAGIEGFGEMKKAELIEAIAAKSLAGATA